MERSAVADGRNDKTQTVVLFGRTGNGKSATGNSISGSKVFVSESSLGRVTIKCKMRKIDLGDEQSLNVIDTPGLGGSSVERDSELIEKEIAECIDMADSGIHAAIVVFSSTHRFTDEEVAVFESLRKFFGRKIDGYMIVVFTGGDTTENVPPPNSPESLVKILEICGNRYVLFDNKTKNKAKKSRQREELLNLVTAVVENNDGKPYSNEPVFELQAEKRLRKVKQSLDRKLEKERAAHAEAARKQEEAARKERAAQKKLNNLEKELEKERAEIETLKNHLETAQRRNEEAQLHAEAAQEKLNNLEKDLSAARQKSNAKIKKLKKSLETAERRNEEACCAIM